MAIGASKEIVPVNTIVMRQITLENKRANKTPNPNKTNQANKQKQHGRPNVTVS